MRSLALAALLVLAACPGPEIVDASSESQPQTGTPGPAALAGTYEVTSSFEVPATAAAPGPLGESLGVLHELSVNPAGGLLDLAETAGVPSLGTLRLLLPDALEGRLEGWMNDYLNAASVNGTSPHARITSLDDRVRSVLLDWDLRSTLTLAPGEAGTHAPVALVFAAAGEPVVVPVEASAPVTAATGVSAIVTWPAAGSPFVTLGDHAIGVPFGHYALTGLDAILAREYGAGGIGAVLGGIVDCAGMARSVADQCVGFLCVGHETELREICEGGVAEAEARLEARILAIDYQAIRFVSGTATAEGIAVDAGTGTASATALSAGEWSATVDLGQEPEAAMATFTATR